ncbi:MAG: cytochrome c oxidase assembly protein, partial [Pseudomonadota bacterium]
MRKLFNRLDGPQKTVAQTLSLVVFMGGLAWASVPFYDWFCRVTGFGGTPGISEVASDDILEQ